MTRPTRVEYAAGHDVYGRRTRLIGVWNGSAFLWSIVSDPVNQRDEGEAIHSLTSGQLVEIGRLGGAVS